MVHLSVRFKNGDEDDWPVDERMNTREFMDVCWRQFKADGKSFFGVAAEDEPIDYGMAGIRWSEVVSFTIDGLLDPNALGPWAELQRDD